jgi:hypothetical protein
MVKMMQHLHLKLEPGLPWQEAPFNKKTLFTSKLNLNLRKEVQCYIWSIALYGAETWPLLKVDEEYLEGFEMWW